MLLTIPQVAEKLELTRQRVHKLVIEGRIEALRVGRDYMIERTELRRFQRSRNKSANGHRGGRPRKSTNGNRAGRKGGK